MKKLITSLACGTVLSMSLLGVGYAANATGATGGNDTHMMNGQGNTMMNQTTGTMNRNDTITGDRNRVGDNSPVSPLANNNQTGRYRATATTGGDNNNDNGNWGWLGLIGLLGLAGMRNKSTERR